MRTARAEVQFEDGPAAGQQMTLNRCPQFLRVVHGPAGWDALDQLDDIPLLEEKVYAYRIHGNHGSAHIDRRDKNGRRVGEWLVLASFRLIPEQPPESVLRDNAQWREWVTIIAPGASATPAESPPPAP